MFFSMPKMFDFTGNISSKSIYFLLQHCLNSSNKCLYFTQEKDQRNIFTHEITPVEIMSDGGQSQAVNSGQTALTPIIYNSVYTLSDGRNRFNVMNFKFGII